MNSESGNIFFDSSIYLVFKKIIFGFENTSLGGHAFKHPL